MTYCANLWPHIFNVGHDYFAWFTAKSKPITVTAQLLVKYKSRFSVFDVAAKPELIPCPHYLNYKVGIY